jgi:predicted short-subunit dehydrogenase-like oxidoreductase (DUF2520 family)
MKHQQLLGLVVEGNATASAILKLPSVLDELGPIKAGVPRVARRLSNFLRAGYPVTTYEELQDARMILLRVPDQTIGRTVNDLTASGLVLKDLAFVLCESCLSTSALAPLADGGAATASIAVVPASRKSWFVVEGQISAVRQIRRLLDRSNARAFELKPGTKPLYFAAQAFALVLPLQLMASAQQALRIAGIKGNHLHELLEEMSFEMFRAFSNGSRFTWPEGRMGCQADTVNYFLEVLRARHPQIAAVLEDQLRAASHRVANQK